MDREELTGLVLATGCVLRGGPGEFDCPTADAKVKLLDLATTADARYDPRVRQIALDIAQRTRTTGPGELARALHAAVKARVRYLGEAIDTFQSAWQTWSMGLGDCDDSARLIAALARSIGLQAHLAILRDPSGEPRHVATQIWDGRTWQWCEATLDARFGEHPVDAFHRLRAEGRPTVITGASGDLASVSTWVNSNVDSAASTIGFTPVALVIGVGLCLLAYGALAK